MKSREENSLAAFFTLTSSFSPSTAATPAGSAALAVFFLVLWASLLALFYTDLCSFVMSFLFIGGANPTFAVPSETGFCLLVRWAFAKQLPTQGRQTCSGLKRESNPFNRRGKLGWPSSYLYSLVRLNVKLKWLLTLSRNRCTQLARLERKEVNCTEWRARLSINHSDLMRLNRYWVIPIF